MHNSEVNALLRRSHFSILTTLGDTFGFSAIESMANWTPVIATRQGALPELDFGQNLNGLAIDQGAKHGVHQFLYGHGQAETARKSPSYLLTPQMALPRVIQIGQSRAEFISNGRNGILVDIPTSELGEWVRSSSPFRAEKRFEFIFTDAVEFIALRALEEIKAVAGNPKRLSQMRQSARQTAVRMFNSRQATKFWDYLYEGTVA